MKPVDHDQEERRPMSSKCLALMHEAMASNMPFNVLRISPYNFHQLCTEQGLLADGAAGSMHWNVKEGATFAGVQVQVDTAVLPGNIWIGQLQMNFQRNN